MRKYPGVILIALLVLAGQADARSNSLQPIWEARAEYCGYLSYTVEALGGSPRVMERKFMRRVEAEGASNLSRLGALWRSARSQAFKTLGAEYREQLEEFVDSNVLRPQVNEISEGICGYSFPN